MLKVILFHLRRMILVYVS